MDGCNNLGDAYTKKSVQSDDKGCLKIKFLEKFKIEDLIGRSVLISSKSHNESENRLACGIIARSSGILQNYKKICACDGTLIWGEKS